MKLAGILTTSVLVAMSWTASAAQPQRLDFRQAVERTFAASPTLAASRSDLRAAEGSAKAARGGRWPQLSASLSANRSNDPLAVFGDKIRQRGVTFGDFGAGQFTGPNALGIAPDTLNHPPAYNNFDTSLELEWPVYDGGKMSAMVTAARAAVTAAKKGDEAARQKVMLQVLRAYEGVRAAAAHLDVARRAEAAAQADLESVQMRFKQGTTIRSDLLTAQVNLDQRRLGLQTAPDHLDTAREYLRILTGMPPGSVIAVGAPAEPKMPAAQLAVLQHEAALHNPTLQSLQHQTGARQAAVDQQRAAYRPHLSLVVRRDWNDNTLGLAAPSYTVAGVVSWHVFDFGVRRGGLDRANGKLDAAQARVTSFRQALQVDVDRTWRQARRAAQRVTTEKTAVEQVTEAQRLIKLRFNQGLATINELLAGEARLDEAQGNLVDARYSLRLSRAQLLADLGQLDLTHFRSSAKKSASPVVPAADTGDSE